MLLTDEREGKMIFTLDGKAATPSSIVVEVPTMNEPLYYGAGDVRELDSRIDKVTASRNGIIAHKENGEELAVPVHLSGKFEAKIYEYGDDKKAWRWTKSENGEVEIVRIVV